MSHTTQSSSPGSSSGHASVSTKIFLIAAIFTLPIGILAYLLAANYTPQIETAQLELAGNALQKPMMKALNGVLSAENTLQTCELVNCRTELAKQSSLVTYGLSDAATINEQHAADLKTDSETLTKTNHKDVALGIIQSEWKALSAAARFGSAAERDETIAKYDSLANRIKQFITYVGNTSNLILDPDLDSYYLVDVTLMATPDLMSHIATSAAIGNKLAAGAGGAVEQAALKNEDDAIQQASDRIAASNQTTFESDAANHGVSPTLEPKLRPALKQYQTAVSEYLQLAKATGANPAQAANSHFANQATALQNATLEYWNVGANELDALLNARIDDFRSSRVQALSYSALAVFVATLIAFLLGRSITKPLQAVVRNLGPGATLLGVSVERIAQASQSATPNPDEAAIICEELNAHADNMRKAVLELARQVEGSAAEQLINQQSGPSH